MRLLSVARNGPSLDGATGEGGERASIQVTSLTIKAISAIFVPPFQSCSSLALPRSLPSSKDATDPTQNGNIAVNEERV